MSTAFTRLVDTITKASPDELTGTRISIRDVWMVLNEFQVLRLEHAELTEAYRELKEEHDDCM